MTPLALIISVLTMVQPPADTTSLIDSRDVQGVTVYARPEHLTFTGAPSLRTSTVDELMEHGNANLVRRAAMASEPIVGGLRGGQVALSIDGMKVHSACVDKMDPATAYVELENLERLEVSAGANDMRYGASAGGALTFRMIDPDVGSPLGARAQVMFNSNGMQRDIKVSGNAATASSAFRAAYTYRAADDYRAGGGALVSGSNFAKYNIITSGSWNVSDADEVSVDAIYDLATFIGYPALLMDTRRAEALIGAITWDHEWNGTVSTSTKLYANGVDHVMDDFSRSDEEVLTRDFMPGMFMPMYGTTFTAGLLSETQWFSSSSVTNLVIDANYLAANATMDMIPLDSTVRPMTLTNIGDARIATVGANLTHEFIVSEAVSLRANGRIDVSPRTMLDESARQVLQAYRPNASIDRTLFAGSGAVMASISNGALQHTFSVSSMERLPTHLEMYGFWLYDPQSNLVTVGDPDLFNERSNGIEATTSYTSDNVSVKVGGSAQWISNYIAPVGTLDQHDLPNDVALRSYSNIGVAQLFNANVSASWRFSHDVYFGASARWTHGRAIDLNDPLPLISPLGGVLRAVWQPDGISLEGRIRGAMRQDRTSLVVLPENATAAWVTADVLLTVDILDGLTLSTSVLNLFDARYHEHTSINDLPAPGRAFTMSIVSTW